MLGSRNCETSAGGIPVDLAKRTAQARVGDAQVRRKIAEACEKDV
jgi:hypothetical protein